MSIDRLIAALRHRQGREREPADGLELSALLDALRGMDRLPPALRAVVPYMVHLDGDSPDRLGGVLEALLQFEQSLADDPGDPDDRFRRYYQTGVLYFCALSTLAEEARRLTNDGECPPLHRVFEHAAGHVRRHRAAVSADPAGPAHAWQRAVECFEVLPERTRRAIRAVASLRAFPADTPELATVAQLAHWRGWGGDGGLFLQGRRAHPDDPIWAVFERHDDLTLGWHPATPGARNLALRQVLFAPEARALGRYVARVNALLLTGALRRTPQTCVTVWADGCGPDAAAEVQLIEEIRGIAGPLTVRLYAADIEHPGDMRSGPDTIVRIHRDLNVDAPPPPSELIDACDAYSCAFVLHQIADEIHRRGRIEAIFRFAVTLVRPGGLISTPDVGDARHLQAILLPINLVDREGGWARDIFSIRGAGGPAHTFRSVAVRSGSGFKTPLPLRGLRHATPAELAQSDLAMYDYTPYVVIDLAVDELDGLDRMLSSGPSQQLELEIERLVERRHPGISHKCGAIRAEGVRVAECSEPLRNTGFT